MIHPDPAVYRLLFSYILNFCQMGWDFWRIDHLRCIRARLKFDSLFLSSLENSSQISHIRKCNYNFRLSKSPVSTRPTRPIFGAQQFALESVKLRQCRQRWMSSHNFTRDIHLLLLPVPFTNRIYIHNYLNWCNKASDGRAWAWPFL